MLTDPLGIPAREGSVARESPHAVRWCVILCAAAICAYAPISIARGGQAQTPSQKRAAQAGTSLWSPPNVDALIPDLSTSKSCPLQQVLAGAAARARELVENLQEFAAREKIGFLELDEFNNEIAGGSWDFDYLVTIQQSRSGLFTVKEIRSGGTINPDFSGAVNESGLPALALIFYPRYSGGYDMECQGQANWSGRAAWVIRFAQRKDKPKLTRSFTTDKGHYPVALKGRAWIAADSFEVLHLETNLIEGVPIIHLRSEAVTVDYAPVQFHSWPVTLWLPQSAEVFTEIGDHRYRVRHLFTDFKVFSISVSQKTGEPKQP